MFARFQRLRGYSNASAKEFGARLKLETELWPFLADDQLFISKEAASFGCAVSAYLANDLNLPIKTNLLKLEFGLNPICESDLSPVLNGYSLHAGVAKILGPYFWKYLQCISRMAVGFRELVLVYYGALLVSGTCQIVAETTFMSIAPVRGGLSLVSARRDSEIFSEIRTEP